MKKSGILIGGIVMIVTVAGIAAVGLSVRYFHHAKIPNMPLEKVILANGHVFMSAPIYIAQKGGYFKEEGLDVTILTYPYGDEALKALLSGKADFATAAETSIILAFLAGQQPRVLATLSTSSSAMAIIHTREKFFIPGMLSPSYRIGTPFNTHAEYFLQLVFLYKGLDPAQIQVSHVEPEAMLDELRTHEIDAAVIWEPIASLIQQKLGPEFVVDHEDGIYLGTWNLTALPDTIEKRHSTIVKILRALSRACRYLHRHSEESLDLTAHTLDVPKTLLEPQWHPYEFNLSLTQEVLLNFETQMRWYRSKNPQDDHPNALQLFSLDPLREVNPEAITLLQAPS